MARHYTRRVALIGVAGAVLTGGSVVRAAAEPHRLPEIIIGRAEALHPQGVAWDPTRQAFLVTSIRHGTVSIVDTNGSVRTLLSHPRMISTTGVHVDLPRGRILVGYADVGLGLRTSPDTRLRVSGVGIFDLASGRPLHLIDLDLVPSTHIISDLTVDQHGTIYASDIASDTIYRIDRHARPSILVRDPRFASPIAGLAGIVWHPNGHLLTAHTETGALFRIRERRVHPVTLDQPVTGADGIALQHNGTLLVVINSLAAPGGNAVTAVHPNHDWSTAHTHSEPWPDPDPTTIALTPQGGYVLTGHLRDLATGHPVDTFTLRRR